VITIGSRDLITGGARGNAVIEDFTIDLRLIRLSFQAIFEGLQRKRRKCAGENVLEAIVGARDPDPQGCRDIASSGAYGEYCEAIHGCACDSCSVQFLDCNTSEACSAIVNCALPTGCRGIACAAPEFCAEVIAQYGGAGTGNIAIEMALQLSECLTASDCAVTCAP
jgi:hypothetical protein